MNSALTKFLKEFGVTLEGHIFEKSKELFLVNDELKQLVEEKKISYNSIGLPLGQETSQGFQASLALLDLMKNTHRFVTITDEGEWLFICGRDVFEENVKEKGDTSRRFLVMNTRKEVLGLGMWKKDGQHRFVTPLLDRGDFLRREQRKKR